MSCSTIVVSSGDNPVLLQNGTNRAKLSALLDRYFQDFSDWNSCSVRDGFQMLYVTKLPYLSYWTKPLTN